MQLIRHANTHPAFISLTRQLDQELARRYGKAQAAYDAHNKMDPIATALVGYINQQPVACGCFKEIRPGTVEIKRMFVNASHRKKGAGLRLLAALEAWARELGFITARLETGKGQPEAIHLYQKAGFGIIPNYGPYKTMDNSVCMEKKIARNDEEKRIPPWPLLTKN